MNELQIFDNGEFEVCFTPAGDSFTIQAPGWTGSAHLVHADAVPRLFFEYQRTERLLGLARRGRQNELVGPQQGELPLEGA